MYGFAGETAYDALIVTTAARHGVPAALVKALIAAESGFRPDATRYEAQQADASLGLMQILFNTARWLGFTGAPGDLYDPATGIEWGTRYLARQWTRYGGVLADAVAAYNSGTVRRADGGGYTNQAYVDKVLTYYAGYVTQWPDTPGAGAILDPLASWAWGTDTPPPAGWSDPLATTAAFPDGPEVLLLALALLLLGAALFR